MVTYSTQTGNVKFKLNMTREEEKGTFRYRMIITEGEEVLLYESGTTDKPGTKASEYLKIVARFDDMLDDMRRGPQELMEFLH